MRSRSKLGLITFIVVAVATGVLALAVLPLWERAGFGEMNIHGIIALIIGYVGVLALTIGLMRLAFHSAEKGFDDRA